MFWKLGGFNFKDAAGIGSLLEKPAHEITLEKVLDEEDLLQEIKVHNARLLDYLRQEHVLSRLLELIIEDSKADDTKAFKYAFIACEILSSEVWSICETIFENPHLLEKFWTFIDAPAPLNPLRASYFTKVNEKFLEKKTEDMIPFIQSIPEVLTKILRHSDTSAIMDLLLKIISMERTDVGAGIVEWLHDEGLLAALMVHLKPTTDPDIQTTVADVVKAIIAISANSNDQGVIGPNALSRSLVSSAVVSSLVANMVQSTETGSNASLTTGVSIIIELIRKNNSDYDLTPIMALAYNNQPPTSRDPIYLGSMLRIFANSIADFQALLLSPKNVRMIKTSGYGEIESLGFERFRICELYAELLHCSNMALLNDPRGESVVKDRDFERDRVKALAKHFEAASESRSTTTRLETEESSLDSKRSRRNSSGTASRSMEGSDENHESPHSEKDQLALPRDSPAAREQRRRSSSEESRQRPEERRGSRGSFDEESRPYMPNTQLHGQEHHLENDKREEELKIMADIGPQTHPVPKPETAPHETLTSATSEIAITSRTPTPPGIDLDTVSPASQVPAVRTTIEEEISTATKETILPTVEEPDLNTELESIVQPRNNDMRPRDIDSSTLRDSQPQSSDHSDTLSITSTSSSHGNSSEAFEPVIGDYLKMEFMNQHVISTILELFFKFPWNNFLHNVVYDVVQQVFNGPMDRGYNRILAIDVFAQGRLCERIVAGQKASDENTLGDGVRLGYMGHLTLIAEEVVKFVERYPPHTISPLITEKVTTPEWIEYVDNTLAATRARDSAVLGGVRPRLPQQNQQQGPTEGNWEVGERSYDMEEDDEELQRQMGQFAINEDSDISADQFANYITQQITNDAPDKFGSSDEDDDDDDQEMSEWMHERGDFLRPSKFDRYEHAEDDQVESSEDRELEEPDYSFHEASQSGDIADYDAGSEVPILGISPPTQRPALQPTPSIEAPHVPSLLGKEITGNNTERSVPHTPLLAQSKEAESGDPSIQTTPDDEEV